MEMAHLKLEKARARTSLFAVEHGTAKRRNKIYNLHASWN